MSSQNLQKPYKQRFKGVENFLRRVAFNLGNTASQTEVKIISCIPIDVTDLQQKIINLEKQLYEAKERTRQSKVKLQAPEKPNSNNLKPNTEKPSSVVNTALYNEPFAKQSSTVSYCSKTPNNMRQQPVSIHCEDCSSRAKKSNVSYVSPALSAPEAAQTTKIDSHDSSNNMNQNANLAAIERYKNIFCKRKRKKVKGKEKLKTQLVYYAQTPNNPFNMHLNTRRYLDSTEVLCLSHLDNVVKRQYDPNIGIEEFSDTSNFTKPICRDTGKCLKQSFQYESDVCSCCHGKFQNIDNYMTTRQNYDYNIFPRAKEPFENTKIYYNSKDYDIIPVKENSNKTLKENLNKKETKIDIDIKCWPEKYRTKYRYHPYVDYQLELPTKRRSPQRIAPKLLEMEIPKRGYRSARCNKLYQHAMDTTSKSCSIDCSNVYKRQPFQDIKIRKSKPVKVIIQKNELISTNDTHHVQVNTQSTDLNTADNVKTESTLDQIKTMLLNVLAEVKTSAKLNNCIEEKVRKDAVVQKGTSQNNMPGASTLLHSFTYNNSYNANPYLPTCSRQIPLQYCFASVPCQPIKLDNFPVLVHPSPRKHMCACYYKNNSLQQTTAATNTDKDIQQSSTKETEKLIKEIYKSMALNLDLTTKENSLSECDDLKSADGSTNTSWKEVKTTEIVTSKRDMEIDAIMTPYDSNSNHSKVVYTANTQFDPNQSRKNEPCYNAVNRNIGQPKNFYRPEHENNIINEDEETDESDQTESNETVIFDQYNKKEKKGFLQRMLKSVKLFNKKKDHQEQRTERGQEESDSDDYETIYSYRSAAPTNTRRRRKKRRNYSKVQYLHENRRERERPYLEQEYRRQWTEGLTFHINPNKMTAEKHFPQQNSKQNPYWKNYKAGSVIVDNNVANNKNLGHDSFGNNTAIQNDKKPKDKLGWLKKHNGRI
ncbi:unnamed protein product, partial [Brenthis ino]